MPVKFPQLHFRDTLTDTGNVLLRLVV